MTILVASLLIFSPRAVLAADTIPWVRTSQPFGITSNSAVFSGIVNAGGPTAFFRFEYAPAAGEQIATELKSAGVGTYRRSVGVLISDLLPNTTYHYRIAAGNRLGATVGDLVSFKTLPGAESRVPTPQDISGQKAPPLVKKVNSLFPWTSGRTATSSTNSLPTQEVAPIIDSPQATSSGKSTSK